jgi:hypothetical protein
VHVTDWLKRLDSRIKKRVSPACVFFSFGFVSGPSIIDHFVPMLGLRLITIVTGAVVPSELQEPVRLRSVVCAAHFPFLQTWPAIIEIAQKAGVVTFQDEKREKHQPIVFIWACVRHAANNSNHNLKLAVSALRLLLRCEWLEWATTSLRIAVQNLE